MAFDRLGHVFLTFSDYVHQQITRREHNTPTPFYMCETSIISSEPDSRASISSHSVIIIESSSGIGPAVASLARKQGSHVAIVSSTFNCSATAISNLKKDSSGGYVTGQGCNIKVIYGS